MIKTLLAGPLSLSSFSFSLIASLIGYFFSTFPKKSFELLSQLDRTIYSHIVEKKIKKLVKEDFDREEKIVFQNGPCILLLVYARNS